MRVAVLGLGEAGSRYAADLVRAGCEVHGYDPALTATPTGVRRARSARAAVRDAELVLGLTGAGSAVAVAAEIAPAMPPGTCLADLNTAAPAVKREVQRAVHSATVADVAVLAPVPHAGLATPLLACGPGAERVAQLLGAVGAPVEVLDAPVGAAAARKLLRSVFMKGLAASALEALAAGAAAGCEEWVRDQLAQELGSTMVERLVTGSRQHAARRVHEIRAARDCLAELGVPADVCEATLAWLDRLAQPEVAR
jgi:3-hydroxyisobutyrate dehydrogenase-like beta-hydroxyacid dehydrogenase